MFLKLMLFPALSNSNLKCDYLCDDYKKCDLRVCVNVTMEVNELDFENNNYGK